MKIFLITLTFLLALILQTTAVSFLSFSDVSPNLILILVLLLIILKDFKNVWWIVVLIGFFIDLFSGTPFGTISLSLVLSSYLIDWLNKIIFSAVKFWMIIALVGIGVLSYNLMLIIFSKFFILIGMDSMMFYYSQGSFTNLTLRVIIEVIYNSFFAILIFYAIKKIFYKEANA